jgi:hypothetical protein
MWTSRTKNDLIIEVWEKLDCESVGACEIEAIQEAVGARFGNAAVESPMRIARLLADEGAALRHSEIMELWVRSYSDQPHEAEFRNLLKLDDLDRALRSLRQVDNLRQKFLSAGDKEGLRLLREEVLEAKAAAQKAARDRDAAKQMQVIKAEIAEWLTIWLQSPEIFENWIKLRRSSPEFKSKFGTEMKD